MSSGITDVKVGYSLVAITHAEGADIPTSVRREHIFRALCMGFPPAGLLTHASLPPPCLRLSTGPPHLSRWEKLGAKPRVPGRWKGLPDVPARTSCSKQVQSELAALTQSFAQLSLETIPFPGPLFQCLTTLIMIFFPIYQVVISSVLICVCCVNILLLCTSKKSLSLSSLHSLIKHLMADIK